MKKMLGIDLGASTVRVCQRHGTVMEEPCVAAVDRNGEISAVCMQAVSMALRTPGNAKLIYPVLDSVLNGYNAVSLILRYCMERAGQRGGMLVIAVPAFFGDREAQAVVSAGLKAGAKEVRLICKSTAAAIGAGVEIRSPQYTMVLELGHGSAEIAAVGEGGAQTVSVTAGGGHALDAGIGQHLFQTLQLKVTDEACGEIKRNAGTIRVQDLSRTPETVRALRLSDGIPCEVTVTPEQARLGMKEGVKAIVLQTKRFYESLSPAMRNDIRIRGLILTGGGAGLVGLDKLLSRELGIPVVLAQSAAECTAGGLTRILGDPEYYPCDDLYFCKSQFGFSD